MHAQILLFAAAAAMQRSAAAMYATSTAHINTAISPCVFYEMHLLLLVLLLQPCHTVTAALLLHMLPAMRTKCSIRHARLRNFCNCPRHLLLVVVLCSHDCFSLLFSRQLKQAPSHPHMQHLRRTM
jgi:hypothetical protein